MMQEKLKGGEAEIAARFLDKAGTIRKIGQTLDEAGRLGLDLLVFPETFLSAYPYWRGAVSVRRGGGGGGGGGASGSTSSCSPRRSSPPTPIGAAPCRCGGRPS